MHPAEVVKKLAALEERVAAQDKKIAALEARLAPAKPAGK